MKKIDIIKAGKLDELKAATFEQKLEANSTGTYTAVLDADEENAVVENVTAGKNGWLDFLERYADVYPMFNGSTLKLIEHLETEEIRTFLAQKVRKWGLAPEVFIKLCDAAIEHNIAETAPIVEAYIQNQHASKPNSDVQSILLRFDGKFEGSLKRTYAKEYEDFFH